MKTSSIKSSREGLALAAPTSSARLSRANNGGHSLFSSLIAAGLISFKEPPLKPERTREDQLAAQRSCMKRQRAGLPAAIRKTDRTKLPGQAKAIKAVLTWAQEQRRDFTSWEVVHLLRGRGAARSACRNLVARGELIVVSKATRGCKAQPAVYRLKTLGDIHIKAINRAAGKEVAQATISHAPTAAPRQSRHER